MPNSILIVDDNEMNRKLLRVLLSSRGYTIAEAENGQQTFERLKEFKPDIILLDYRLPDMNGAEIARALKADSAFAAIPVIIITAIAGKDDLDSIIQASGCTDCLTKPIDVHTLLGLVQKHVGSDAQLP